MLPGSTGNLQETKRRTRLDVRWTCFYYYLHIHCIKTLRKPVETSAPMFLYIQDNPQPPEGPLVVTLGKLHLM